MSQNFENWLYNYIVRDGTQIRERYAKQLIDQCAEQHGMLERRKPFVVDAMALIEEALSGKEVDVENENEVMAEGAEE